MTISELMKLFLTRHKKIVHGILATFALTSSLTSFAMDRDAFAALKPGLYRILDDRYRIGSEWGKTPVSATRLGKENSVFQRAARATARVGGATGFYLGQFNGLHVMATNHHVYERAYQCLGNSIEFPFLRSTGARRFKCEKFFGSWSEIDLALFSIEVKDAQDAEALATVAQNFAFTENFTPGLPLVTIGFGVANNRGREMMANQDLDCKIFSSTNDFRFMGDPDQLNPGTYQAWSFSNGCDVSHGDSGSAMVNRENGHVMGIIWTGRVPKSAQVQDSRFLDELIINQGQEIWTELSFAVPAPKIGDHLKTVVNRGMTDQAVLGALRALTQ